MEVVKDYGAWLVAAVATLVTAWTTLRKSKVDETAQALTAWKEMRIEMQKDRDDARKRAIELQDEVDNLRNRLREMQKEMEVLQKSVRS